MIQKQSGSSLNIEFSFEEIFCTLNAFLGSNDFLDLQGLQRHVHVRSVGVLEGFYFFVFVTTAATEHQSASISQHTRT